MLFTRHFLMVALAATGLSAHAQSTTHSYTSVDAYGNVVRQTVQTPLAGASSVAALIAQQGILGANTTSSTYSYTAGNVCAPIYTNPYAPNPYANNYYPPAYGYQYPGTVNNYYYPAQPSSGPIAPPSYNWEQPAWITNTPLGGGYAAPAYPAYGYSGYGYPTCPYPGYSYPAYGGAYYNGAGSGSIITQSQSSGYGVSIGRGGITGHFESRNSGSSTTVTQGYDNRQIKPNRNIYRPTTTVPPAYIYGR